MAEVNTFGETARLGQLVLSLCLRSSSGWVGMFGETGSLVGVLLPPVGYLFNAANGEVAGDGFNDEAFVLDKYVGVRLLEGLLFDWGAFCRFGCKMFLWPCNIPLSPDGVPDGDGGVFKMIRLACRVSFTSVVGGCLCFVLEDPNATSTVNLGIIGPSLTVSSWLWPVSEVMIKTAF